jgi:DNA polymerase III epsilon subunit family exonuclease
VSSSPVFVAFDVETTGLVAGVDSIIELAAVSFQGERALDTFATLVDPGIPIPATATAINGITDGMVRGAPAIAETLPGFLSFLSGGTPVAHNAMFDVAFVSVGIASRGLPPPAGQVLDTRSLARRAFPRRTSYSLVNLSRDLALETDGAHRAMADAQACRRLFHRCLSVLFPGTEPSLAELVALNGAPLDFADNSPRMPRIAALLREVMAVQGEAQITYRSSRGELTERRIRPLSFDATGGRIGVVAFCLLRNEERTFLLDSIMDARRAQ